MGNLIFDGFVLFYRVFIFLFVFCKFFINFGGILYVKLNRLCIILLESRVSRRGKLVVKGNFFFRLNEVFSGDSIEFKCEVLEV